MVPSASGKDITGQNGEYIEGLPFFTLNDVALHATVENKIWVAFNQGVYDVTEFISKHPGGSIIMKGAGRAVDVFFATYAVHKEPVNLNLFEKFRIGNLNAEETKGSCSDLRNLFSDDPVRNPGLIANFVTPYNAEPPPLKLIESYITPVNWFFVRNHLAVPEVDPDKYRLIVEGLGVRSTTFTLDDIKSFPKCTITSTLVCAGNRRQEMAEVKPLKGVPWNKAAIGNTKWSGVRLYELLSSLGLKDDEPGVQHVQFEGLDKDQSLNHYGCSIPIEKAMDPKGDVLLVYEMNGKQLSRDHGFPLRVIVPGTSGTRNCKWLASIRVSESENPSHWQQSAYKGFSPSTDLTTADFSMSPAVQVYPVTSACCDPVDGQTVQVHDGKITVRGYAFSGGGNKIIRVDISTDLGKSWHIAGLQQDVAKYPRHWSWTLWKAILPVDDEEQMVEIWVKAIDSSYNTQPENFKNIWNFRGVVSNAYNKIKVKLIR